MFIEIIGAIALLALIIVMVMPRKTKTKIKSKPGFTIDTDTRFANYAINANGKLERVHGNSLIND